MKKFCSSILISLVFFSTPINCLANSQANGIILNGNEIYLDVNPIIKDGRTLVPARALFENLGFEVRWDNDTKTILGQKEDSLIELAIDNTLDGNRFNGNKIYPDVPATIVNNRTFVPARLVAELLGLDVSWDDGSRKVVINSKTKSIDFETRVAELTNNERVKNGLKPLELSSELSKIARLKSEDMKANNYFDHKSPTYGSPFDMMDSFGIKYLGAGENIAMGHASPEQVVDAWMKSEGHRKNILNPNYDTIGVGYASGYYWTQMFTKRM